MGVTARPLQCCTSSELHPQKPVRSMASTGGPRPPLPLRPMQQEEFHGVSTPGFAEETAPHTMDNGLTDRPDTPTNGSAYANGQSPKADSDEARLPSKDVSDATTSQSLRERRGMDGLNVNTGHGAARRNPSKESAVRQAPVEPQTVSDTSAKSAPQPKGRLACCLGAFARR
mmetsp:Transcript_30532/g.56370  ORF Transcript_30532/g.56370 Transcript_30532/m.56370 type:complete len:172 (+) Transcript_30532:194-709(+)